jgi:hypothetical protein
MNKEKAKERLLEEFDFDTAHSIMKLLDWKWTLLGGVPTPSQIKESVGELIDGLLNDDRCLSVSSGGFSVKRTSELNEEEYDTVVLSFEALKSHSFFNE